VGSIYQHSLGAEDLPKVQTRSLVTHLCDRCARVLIGFAHFMIALSNSYRCTSCSSHLYSNFSDNKGHHRKTLRLVCLCRRGLVSMSLYCKRIICIHHCTWKEEAAFCAITSEALTFKKISVDICRSWSLKRVIENIKRMVLICRTLFFPRWYLLAVHKCFKYRDFREEWRRWCGPIRCRPSSCLPELYLHVLKQL